jgi:hypothetical protein
MFDLEDPLVRSLWGLGGGSLVLTALITWAMARRYGQRRALVVPAAALLAAGLMLWRSASFAGHDALSATAAAMLLAGPALAGGLLGLLLAGLRRG